MINNSLTINPAVLQKQDQNFFKHEFHLHGAQSVCPGGQGGHLGLHSVQVLQQLLIPPLTLLFILTDLLPIVLQFCCSQLRSTCEEVKTGQICIILVL